MTGATTVVNAPSLHLSEWETRDPVAEGPLFGQFLSSDEGVRATVQELAARQMLHVTELRQGLRVEATSFVGRIRLGDLTITIHPKVAPDALLRLLRYAYGLGDLQFVGGNASYQEAATPDTFQDLLVLQLVAEVRRLIARGLHREYRRQAEPLATPRGRIDMERLARDAASGIIQTQATLPCIHYERSGATALHAALSAGLRFAEELTSDPALSAQVRRLNVQFDAAIGTPSPLDPFRLPAQLRAARRSMSRLTTAYDPALTLIELLSDGVGPTLAAEKEAPARSFTLPGFLFDMNRFFQRLIERFLTDYLPGDYTVQSERRLRRVFVYHPDHNPHRRRAPTPRPDFAIVRDDATIALLDAKYRDLWTRSLPREMLYQLAVYAAFGPDNVAAILYPTTDPSAREQRVEIQPSAVTGERAAAVVLRPVDLNRLAEIVAPTMSGSKSECQALAHQMAFGVET